MLVQKTSITETKSWVYVYTRNIVLVQQSSLRTSGTVRKGAGLEGILEIGILTAEKSLPDKVFCTNILVSTLAP